MGVTRETRSIDARCLGRAAALAFCLHATAAAQVQDPYEPNPAALGQWEGRYTIARMGAQPVVLLEIAHAVVLPGTEGEVLFWNNVEPAQFLSNPIDMETRTFLWNAGSPQAASVLIVPNSGYGNQDLFCGGHTFAANGDVWTFGGTDLPNLAHTGQTLGHVQVFRFDVVQRQWFVAPSMVRKRWYPNGFLLPDGRFAVMGHTNFPLGSELATDFFDGFGWIDQLNWQVDATSTCVDFEIPIGDYPRGHLLSSRLLFWPGGGTPSSPVSRFLDLNVGACAPKERWRSRSIPGAGQHAEGNSVHFVWYDGNGVAHDTVYVIAGTQHVAGQDFIHGNAEKITDPFTAAAWASVAPLAQARVDSNAVLLPTGEIIVLGGDQGTGPGNWIPVLVPEVYRPPEIDAASPGTWRNLAPHADPRTYHFVAGLLSDGRVFVAGGDYRVPGPPEHDARHTVEIYRPPYMFRTERPVVSVSDVVWSLDPPMAQPPVLTVTTANASTTVARICLIKTGSITHGFDSSQRYVQLRTALVQGQAPNLSITVTVPQDYAHAPKGDYFLFVVDSAGIPSEGVVIRIS